MADFSTKQYGWKDLAIAYGGRILDGITEVEYTAAQEKDVLRGRGADPHAVLRGNKTYSGKITIWQSELEAMTRDAPNKDILALNFTTTVTYVPADGGQAVTDILLNCEFTEVKKGLKQGDKNMLVELPFIFTGLKPQQ
ncbi:hypothetical protein R1T16_17485 [Flavobacterium sp. DG1-102-2]|uniref:hypothetical protein n=1 Tax=Flavobacterium sp. DG1-102-2 TaxID=3081663 RepID=UPI002949C7D3|nr:hypothetical protein [Flavobacterium sp. DG1-102-2]MDV6170233.1 hypothetical protein [Flavobacterium sp. DG1-102-2]